MAITNESGPPTGEKVLPFYIVCDESASMYDNGGIDAINQSLPELHATISADPLVNDKTRIALIAFSSTAEVLVPLAAAADIGEMPGVDADGATDYGSAFQLLKDVIDEDVAALRNTGYQVLRPTVFFISDGEPTVLGWETSHTELTDKSLNPWAANIVAFGVDCANPDTIKKVATVRGGAFESTKGTAPGEALTEIIPAIAFSIVASGQKDDPELVLPTSGEGFSVIPLDVLG